MSSLSAQAKSLIQALSNDKTNEDIALEIQEGNEDLLFELWLRVCRIIAVCASRYYRQHEARCQAFGVTIDDLEQEGFFAVQEAVGSFRLESGYKFTAFLKYPLLNRFNTLSYCRTDKQKKAITNILSLDAPIYGENDDYLFSDTIRDDSSLAKFEQIENEDYVYRLHETLDTCLASLPKQDEALVRSRHYDGSSLEELSRKNEVSLPEIRRRLDRCYSRLRTGDNLKRLKSYRADIIDRYAYNGRVSNFKSTHVSSVERAFDALRREGLT